MRALALFIGLTLTASSPMAWAQSEAQVNPPGGEHAKRAGDLPKGRPGPGMVWVDSKHGIYYRQGNAKYGKTKHGAYMSEGDAVNRGYVDRTQQPIKKAGEGNE